MADIFGKAENVSAPTEPRFRRSEVLLTRLYRDRINPRAWTPYVRGAKTMAIISVLAIVVFTGTLFFKFNSFILLREDVLSMASNLESAIQRRSNLFSNLVNLTLNHASLEHAVFTFAARMRTQIVKQGKLPADAARQLLPGSGKGGRSAAADPLPDDWTAALKAPRNGGGAVASLGRLLAVVERYPDIQSAKTYIKMMSSLIDMEDLIAKRRMEYNASARMFNAAISKFPWKLLAKWTHFERFAYFIAGAPGAGGPLITLDVFKQLMPLDTPPGAAQ